MNENKIKVLVVEDNPGDAFLIEEMLRGLNLDLKVTQLGDGRQAMDALMAKGFISPDLVILDLNLPRVYGLDVLAYMKSIPALSFILVIMMTGYLKGEDESEREAWARPITVSSQPRSMRWRSPI